MLWYLGGALMCARASVCACVPPILTTDLQKYIDRAPARGQLFNQIGGQNSCKSAVERRRPFNIFIQIGSHIHSYKSVVKIYGY